MDEQLNSNYSVFPPCARSLDGVVYIFLSHKHFHCLPLDSSLLMALTGTVLPIVYFFHRRFPSENPAEANVIVRQALWFGVYGATLAWLQLGRLVTVYVVLGLAGGLVAIEYFMRLREKAHWKPPVTPDDQPS
jgi:hypothetical protein